MNNVHFAIPEIYGETLSYYELLRKLIDKINELIDNYNTVPEQIADAVKNLDAAQLFSAVLDQLIDTIATDNTKSNYAVKVYKKHDLLYATFNETVNLYESLIDFSTGTELIPDTNIREVNISELFIELRELIDVEKQTREQGDTSLQNAINTEKSVREQADTTLQQNINTEVSSREQADTTLQNAINTEKSAREQGDTALQNAINAEKSAREQADNTLQTNIDNAGIKMNLLWTNNNDNNAFNAQTINIDTREYKLLIIDFKLWSEGDQYEAHVVSKNNSKQEFSGVSDYLVQREFVVNDSNISVHSGKWKYTQSSDWTSDDRAAIPYKIYGIK